MGADHAYKYNNGMARGGRSRRGGGGPPPLPSSSNFERPFHKSGTPNFLVGSESDHPQFGVSEWWMGPAQLTPRLNGGKKSRSKGTRSKGTHSKVTRSKGTRSKVTRGGMFSFIKNAVASHPAVTVWSSFSGGKSRKSSKKTLRRKSLVHKKKRCPKYCRRKSVRYKSYRPVRKSRKHNN